MVFNATFNNILVESDIKYQYVRTSWKLFSERRANIFFGCHHECWWSSIFVELSPLFYIFFYYMFMYIVSFYFTC